MEHFIETVHKYPCLWSTTAIEYRDQELKDAAWAEVMKETDLSSVKEVKMKWKKLRDSYRDALKRQSEMLAKEPANQSKKNYPWKYMGAMQFLQPYMSNRKKPGEGVPTAPPPRNGHAANGFPPAPGTASASDSSESESEAESVPRAPAKRRLLDRSLEYTQRRQRAPARADAPSPAATAPAPSPDPLDIFFNSMCQSTKRFAFQTQIKIKRTLFEAVTQAEEALLAEQQSYASLWAGAGAARASSSASSEPDVKPC